MQQSVTINRRNNLYAILFFTSFVVSLANTASYHHHHHHDVQATPLTGEIGHGDRNSEVIPRRWAAETTNSSNDGNDLVLAEERTKRRDPTDDNKYYTGGWNISDSHYWASVGSTAVPFFTLAIVWFIGFGICLVCICFCFCCCRNKQPYGYSRTCYALSLILLIIFTIAAIIGSIILYTGQEKFHISTTKTLDYVVDQADATAKNLTHLSDYLNLAKSIKIGPNGKSLTLPENLRSKIDNIQVKISDASSTLSTQTHDNAERIQNLLKYVRLALIVIAAVMLFLAFVGFLLSICGVQCLVYTLVIVGWILVTLTFILCGVFLLIHNVAADTCVSMNEWVANPKAHTALDDILPCVDKSTAQDILNKSKEVTHEVVTMIDNLIVNVSNTNFPPQATPLYYNQSGPLLPLLCNPYNPDLSDRACFTGEVDYNNATMVWKNYVCQVSKDSKGNTVCKSRGRLTPVYYNELSDAVNVSSGVYTYTPFLVDLADCTFVRRTFKDIGEEHCPDLKEYTRWIYAGLVTVSGAVMFSLIFWVIYARERRHRVYTKRVNARSGGGVGSGRSDGVPLVRGN